MARKRLTIALAVAGLLVLGVPAAQAAMAVFDSAAVAKAIEQLKELKAQLATEMEQLAELKQQVSFLNEITGFVNDLSDSVGDIISISLPIPNILQMAAQINSDMRCLMPDGMSWGIELSDLNLASICETSSKYRDALFVNDDELSSEAFVKSEEAWAKINERRTALLEDTAVRALAQGDVQLQQASEINEAADQLQDDLAGAKTVQDRLHVTAQAQILHARAMASQNQILAQQLRLMAIAEIKKGLPPSKVKEITGEEDEE